MGGGGGGGGGHHKLSEVLIFGGLMTSFQHFTIHLELDSIHIIFKGK